MGRHIILDDCRDVQHREIVDFLLDHGVDINRPDVMRSTGRHSVPLSSDYSTFDKTLGVLNAAAARDDIKMFDHRVLSGCGLHTAAAYCSDPVKVKAMIAHLVATYSFDPKAKDNVIGLRSLGIDPSDTGVPLDFTTRQEHRAALRRPNLSTAQTQISEELEGPVRYLPCGEVHFRRPFEWDQD
ncbi:hypothetical protein JX265_011861 [Neoarthrinium moseri]|uniref:Ankyrin repeat protein n=1 Tax=Neoarthrinium moseri TaxID=1658444 RepID=A0A9P9WBR5_9PEZI|nr:hypothetical protein JX265_011861 [Neoarthrinium moseri]